MKRPNIHPPSHLRPGMFQKVELLEDWDGDYRDVIEGFRRERDPSEIEFFESVDSLALDDIHGPISGEK